MRSLLYMSALGGARGHNVLREFYQRLVAAGKPKKLALIAAARKILVWAWAVFRDHADFDPTRANGAEPPACWLPDKLPVDMHERIYATSIHLSGRGHRHRSDPSRVGAHDPAVATQMRRTGLATPGCVPGAPISSTAAAPAESIRRPGTHRAVDRACAGAATDRRRPAECPYATSIHLSRRGHRHRSDLARRGTRPGGGNSMRRTGLATPGCVPDPPISSTAAAPAESIRRPGTHRAGERACAGAATDRRRPAVCPYATSASLCGGFRLATCRGTPAANGATI